LHGIAFEGAQFELVFELNPQFSRNSSLFNYCFSHAVTLSRTARKRIQSRHLPQKGIFRNI